MASLGHNEFFDVMITSLFYQSDIVALFGLMLTLSCVHWSFFEIHFLRYSGIFSFNLSMTLMTFIASHNPDILISPMTFVYRSWPWPCVPSRYRPAQPPQFDRNLSRHQTRWQPSPSSGRQERHWSHQYCIVRWPGNGGLWFPFSI